MLAQERMLGCKHRDVLASASILAAGLRALVHWDCLFLVPCGNICSVLNGRTNAEVNLGMQTPSQISLVQYSKRCLSQSVWYFICNWAAGLSLANSEHV